MARARTGLIPTLIAAALGGWMSLGASAQEPASQPGAVDRAAQEAAMRRAREESERRMAEQVRQREKIDTAALDAIVLPENPTRDDCRAYIEAILAASQKQQHMFSIDPQVGKLAAVPPEHFDTLLAQWGGGNRAQTYVILLLQSDHAERYRQAVIDRMAEDERLLSIVQRRQWESHATPLLVERLRRDPIGVSPVWVRVAASTNDPRVVEPLVVRLIQCPGRSSTFNMLERLDTGGHRLDAAVDAAWHQIQLEGDAEARSFALIAARFGHLDAVDSHLSLHLARLAAVEGRDEATRQRYRASIDQQISTSVIPLFDYRGESSAFLEWYQQHRADIEWDPYTRKYYVPTAA